MLDIRANLKRSLTVPQTTRKASRFAVVHWGGLSVFKNGIYPGDIATLKEYANWHVNNNGWDGLSYTYAIGRMAQAYQCRDWNAKLAHAGNTLMNNEGFSVLVITGDGDPVSELMLDALLHRLRSTGIERRYWLGHQESPRSTACPGALLLRWLKARRAEVRIPSEQEVRVFHTATVRDEFSTLSAKLGSRVPDEIVCGTWVLGQPVKGDSLWLELKGDQFIHASALDTRSYIYAG